MTYQKKRPFVLTFTRFASHTQIGWSIQATGRVERSGRYGIVVLLCSRASRFL
jgi:hypothetical protein